MKYGYFDLENKEYVITRPDTPAPWANYLGSPEYGAIISNNAAGYSFVKSGANGRIIRYRFNSNMALPGRYIYIRDNETKDYWSASWQPVGKPLDKYKSECRHGTAYTVISSEYEGISAQTTYYVPIGKTHEVWNAKITNNSGKERKLSVFGFVEFTNENNYEQDQVNLQYTLFITRTSFEGNKILQHINENSGKRSDGSNGKERFFGMVGASINAYNGDLEAFIGPYRTYSNPIAVETGRCDNTLNYNMNACGALQSDVVLKPGESITLTYVLGQKTNAEADAVLEAYKVPGTVEKELDELKSWWHSKLGNFVVKTPSEEFNNMLNVWNAYQCFITFIWSRAASFVYCGLRNGYGYRDTVQDIQGIIHLDPEMAAEKIRFMLSAQVDNGGGLPLVKFDHKAGHENTPDDIEYVRETGHPSYRADDALWLFPTVYKYIAESGNKAFIDEVIVFANGGEGTVYEHLKRAIQFSMERLGDHNMPAGLHADWNDCLRLGKKGESTFVAFQLYYAIKILREFAVQKNDADYIKYLDEICAKLSKTLEECWDEDRFIRGIREDGVVVGSRKDPEANMWLNPQSWAVISGFASKEQAEKAMDSVYRLLNTKYGIRLLTPCYVDHYFDGALMHIFNPSTKENGGIFSQSQGWAILAEALLGHGDRAFEYFMETSPAAMNDRAEIRVIEPYAHGQFVESVDSPFEGRAHVHWLTGTASTVMVGCVEGILGMRPNADGLVISPSVPSSWEEFSIEKTFRGKKLFIEFKNSNHAQCGAREVILNGEKLEGNFVPAAKLKDENKIVVNM
jgi:cellobiose phosphorylase